MDNSGEKRNIKKILIVSICSILGLVVILTGIVYIIMRSYISKINFVPLEELDYAESGIGDDNWDDEADWDNDEEWDYEMESGNEDGVEAVGADGNNDLSKEDETSSVTTDSSSAIAMTDNTLGNEGNLKLDEEVSIEASIRKNINDSSITIMQDKNVLNVLLIGTDNRKSGQRGLSDSMIIVSINTKTKRIIATSLLRDIYLHIPGKKNNNRLNTAYAAGGTKLLIETIEKNFKLHIDKYASVDFYAFIDIVDQVGGITLEITKEELPIVNNYIREINRLKGLDTDKDCLTEEGTQLINGKQALGYARVRYVGTDFGRTARQRMVLELIFGKVKKMKMNEIGKLLSAILPEVTTNFTEKEMMAQIIKLPGYLEYEIDSWSVPVKGSYSNVKIRKMSVLGIDFDKNRKEIYEKIYLTK